MNTPKKYLLTALLLSCAQLSKPISESGVVAGTIGLTVLGGIVGGSIAALHTSPSSYRYHDQNDQETAFIIGGAISAACTGLLAYLVLKDMTPQRRYERAYNLIASAKNKVVVDIATQHNLQNKNACAEAAQRAYVSYDLPLLKATFALERVYSDMHEAINLLHMAKGESHQNPLLRGECAQLLREAELIFRRTGALLTTLKGLPEYSMQLRTYKAELEAERLRDEIRYASNQIANEIHWQNRKKETHYHYHNW